MGPLKVTPLAECGPPYNTTVRRVTLCIRISSPARARSPRAMIRDSYPPVYPPVYLLLSYKLCIYS